MKVSLYVLVIGAGLLIGCGENSIGQDPVKAVVEETEATEVGFGRVSPPTPLKLPLLMVHSSLPWNKTGR